ncbi:hypothetical protein C8J57DRAFT_1184552 [Mycena rebaudengoi]|nr:hypothetical protein C8J57DRAFT_1187299 [Mycena rebaudengoi]KAJ7260597.1 hypothetical protein C8J57DRAFT_1184552 [Mycena rebaudengoi]
MSSYTPNETPAELFSEIMWLQGYLLTSMAYGVVLTLFFMCFHLLLKQRTKKNHKITCLFLLYISIEFILGTLLMGSTAKYTQLAFIENRNFPGGPGAYEVGMFSIPVGMLGHVAFVLTNLFSDALVVWRFYVIYHSCGVSTWRVIVIPLLMLIASVVLGILWLFQISGTLSSSPSYTLPCIGLSLALNILVTIAIVGRLFVYRRRANILGSNHGSQYTSIAAMVVESAFIFSAFSMLVLVPFGMNSALFQLFLQPLSQVQIISTILIVFRAAQGKGWTISTQERMTQPSRPQSIVQFVSPRDSPVPSQRSSTTVTGHADTVPDAREFEKDAGSGPSCSVGV